MENVTKWLSKFESEATRTHYQQTITDFSRYMKEKLGLDVETLKDDYREAKYKGEIDRQKFLDRLQDAVEDYVCIIKSRNYTNMVVKTYISTVASFIRKGCKIKDVEIDIPKRVYAEFHNRDITKEEIRKILEHASLRDRTFDLALVESGLRPSTLLQLTYDLIKQDYEANRVPMKIDLPSRILKDRISARWTFIGEDGARLLHEYLSTRKDIKDNDLIFVPERPGRAKGKTLTESAFSNKFNKLILKLGLDTPTEKKKPKSLRLYNLRKFFFNNMKTDSAYRNFWFCHKTIDDHYISQDVEKHREKYLEGYKSLRVFEPTENAQVDALTHELERSKEQIKKLEQQLETKRIETDSKIEDLEQRFIALQKQLKGLLGQK